MASERSQKGGGNEIPLTDGYGQVSVSYSTRGVQGAGASWFGPLETTAPIAPPEVASRRFDFPTGYNRVITPRAYDAIGFQTMRALADNYDILRLVIETRKDQVARMKWNVVPRDPTKSVKGAVKKRIEQVEAFFLRPDKEHFWDEWIRLILEDLLVLDAPTIYKRKTRGGDLYSLEPLAGDTIKVVIDDWGRVPEAPYVAYQQVLKGFPAVDYSKDEVIYRPRNIRTNKVYGFSPVEQIIMTVAIAMKRQVFQLNYFTEGNVPEALIGVPEQWTPDQIQQFQDWFDGILQGNLAERRRARFVPSAVGKTYIPMKETELFGKAEEWLARVVCFAFSINPQPFVNQMNRATSQDATEASLSEGLGPLLLWIKGLIDGIILDEFGFDDVMFQWDMDWGVDPKDQADILDTLVGSSIMSINEARVKLGLDPREEDIFNDLMYKSSMGYVQTKNGYIPTTAQTSSAQGGTGGRPANTDDPGPDDEEDDTTPEDEGEESSADEESDEA